MYAHIDCLNAFVSAETVIFNGVVETTPARSASTAEIGAAHSDYPRWPIISFTPPTGTHIPADVALDALFYTRRGSLIGSLDVELDNGNIRMPVPLDERPAPASAVLGFETSNSDFTKLVQFVLDLSQIRDVDSAFSVRWVDTVRDLAGQLRSDLPFLPEAGDEIRVECADVQCPIRDALATVATTLEVRPPGASPVTPEHRLKIEDEAWSLAFVTDPYGGSDADSSIFILRGERQGDGESLETRISFNTDWIPGRPSVDNVRLTFGATPSDRVLVTPVSE